jgi:hypothetical protein
VAAALRRGSQPRWSADNGDGEERASGSPGLGNRLASPDLIADADPDRSLLQVAELAILPVAVVDDDIIAVNGEHGSRWTASRSVLAATDPAAPGVAPDGSVIIGTVPSRAKSQFLSESIRGDQEQAKLSVV